MTVSINRPRLNARFPIRDNLDRDSYRTEIGDSQPAKRAPPDIQSLHIRPFNSVRSISSTVRYARFCGSGHFAIMSHFDSPQSGSSGAEALSPPIFGTPPALVEELISWSGRSVDALGSSLTKTVRECCSNHCCTYTAAHTGNKRVEQTYRCADTAFGHPDVACPSYFRFNATGVDCRRIITFADAEWNHNHPTSAEYYELHSRRLTEDQIEKIHELAALGATPGMVRAQLGVAIQPDKLYYEMKKGRRQIPSEAHELLKETVNWTGWTMQNTWAGQPDEGRTLMDVFFLHNRIAACPFSAQVFIIDDTFCTNHFDIPVVAIIVPDCELRNQLLAFGFLCDRTRESFERFLRFVQDAVPEVTCVVTDRALAQIAAIRLVYSRARIRWCYRHFLRNMESAFPNQPEVLCRLTDLLYGVHLPRYARETRFKETLERLKPSFTEHQRRVWDEAEDQITCWWPSSFDYVMDVMIQTTNRVEGFFGILKQGLDHRRVRLAELAREIKSLAVTAYQRLFQEVEKHSHPNQWMSDNDAVRVSFAARDLLFKEGRSLSDSTPPPIDGSPWGCCSTRARLGIPCVHIIAARQQNDELVSVTDFHERWLQLDKALLNQQARVIEEFRTVGENGRPPRRPLQPYPYWQSHFETWFDAATKRVDVAGTLQRTLDELSRVRRRTEVGAGVIPMPGRPPTRPALKVRAMAKKQTRKRKGN